jgi:hypothetical protein
MNARKLDPSDLTNEPWAVIPDRVPKLKLVFDSRHSDLIAPLEVVESRARCGTRRGFFTAGVRFDLLHGWRQRHAGREERGAAGPFDRAA